MTQNGPRRYLAIVQDDRGYPPPGAPLEEASPPPVIYQVVKADDHDAEVERLQGAIDRAHAVMRDSEYVGGRTEREAWQEALATLSKEATQHVGQDVPNA